MATGYHPARDWKLVPPSSFRSSSCTSSSRRLPDPLLPPSSAAGSVCRDLDEPRAPAGTRARDRARVCGGAGTHGGPRARIAGRRGGRAPALHTAAVACHLAARPCSRRARPPCSPTARQGAAAGDSPPAPDARCPLPVPHPGVAVARRMPAPRRRTLAPPTGTTPPSPSPMCFGGVGVLDESRNTRGSVGIWSFLLRFEIILIHLFTRHYTDIQSRVDG